MLPPGHSQEAQQWQNVNAASGSLIRNETEKLHVQLSPMDTNGHATAVSSGNGSASNRAGPGPRTGLLLEPREPRVNPPPAAACHPTGVWWWSLCSGDRHPLLRPREHPLEHSGQRDPQDAVQRVERSPYNTALKQKLHNFKHSVRSKVIIVSEIQNA